MQTAGTASSGAQKNKRIWAPNLRTKFTIGILILGIVLASATLGVTYFSYRDANLAKYQRIVSACAQMAASMVSGDDVARYLQTKQVDEQYRQTQSQMQNLLEYNDLTYLYVYYPDFEHQIAPYAFNLAHEGDITPEEKKIGYTMAFEIDENDASIAIVRDVIQTQTPNLNLNLSTSMNGSLASAFVPLMNSAGDVVAIVGADVSVDQVFNDLNDIMLLLSCVILLIIALSVFFFQRYVARTMIHPLQQLVNSAQNFVTNHYGESESSYEPLKINTRDELEKLANAFNEMTEDILQYIKDVTALTNERERIAAELAVATKIQESALPSNFDIAPHPGDFQIFATMDPAKEVGGDLYDFFMLGEDRLCLVLGDVSGKGVPAALFMMMAKSVIRDQMLKGYELSEAFTLANAELCAHNEEGMFVTVQCVVLDLKTGEITVGDAGHGSPIRIDARGELEFLKTKRGFVMAGMEGVRYRTCTYQLNPGDVIYLYTDGVNETDNERKELYGNARVEESIRRHWHGDLQALLHGIRSDLFAFADGAPQADDITMLAMQYKPKQ